MDRVSKPLLFAILGLLASPTLAKGTGLRGSAKDDTAAAEDHSENGRKLEEGSFLEFYYDDLPFPPELPDILPGIPIEFPFMPKSFSFKETGENTASTNTVSETLAVALAFPAEDGPPEGTVGYNQVLTSETTEGSEVFEESIEVEFDDDDIASYEFSGGVEISASNQAVTEETTTITHIDEEGIVVYHNNSRGYELSEGEELIREEIYLNDTDAVRYYYAERSENEEEAEEDIYQEFNIEFATTTPPPMGYDNFGEPPKNDHDRRLKELSSPQAVKDLVEKLDEDANLDGIHYRKDGLLSRSECDALIRHFDNKDNSALARNIPSDQSFQAEEFLLTRAELAGVIGEKALRGILAFLFDSLGQGPVTAIVLRRTYADGVNRVGKMHWHMHEKIPGFREGTVAVALNADGDVEGGALYFLAQNGPVKGPRTQGSGYAFPYNTVHTIEPYHGARYSLFIHTNQGQASAVHEI